MVLDPVWTELVLSFFTKMTLREKFKIWQTNPKTGPEVPKIKRGEKKGRSETEGSFWNQEQDHRQNLPITLCP